MAASEIGGSDCGSDFSLINWEQVQIVFNHKLASLVLQLIEIKLFILEEACWH
jgi:hypothetical protein